MYGSGISDVQIIYRPGRSNANADALSRSPCLPPPVEGIGENECQVASLNSSGKQTENISELLMLSGQKPSTTPFEVEQRKDGYLAQVFKFLEEGILPADDKLARKVAMQAPLFTVNRKMLYYIDPKPSCKCRVVVPSHFQKKLMEESHRSIMGGHFSGKRTYDSLSQIWWWESMYRDVMTYVQSCPECLVSRGDGRNTRSPLHPIPVNRPFQIVGVDIMDLPVTASGNRHVVVFQDYLSKWPLIFPTPDQKTQRIVDLLVKEIIPQFGVPECLLSDRGTNLLSYLMKDVCKSLGVQKLNTTAYHPQADGMVERFNRTLKEMLKKHAARYGKQWDQHLYGVLWAYRNTVHESTAEKPSFLLYGIDLRSPPEAELLQPQEEHVVEVENYREQLMITLRSARLMAAECIRQAQKRYKHYYDQKAIQREYKVGDWVLVRFPQEEKGKQRKLSHPWHGPYRVIARQDPDLTVVKVYYPQEGQIQIHQERVCFCPPAFPAGYFWYGTRRHSVGRPPKWVQNLLQGGSGTLSNECPNGESDCESPERGGDPTTVDVESDFVNDHDTNAPVQLDDDVHNSPDSTQNVNDPQQKDEVVFPNYTPREITRTGTNSRYPLRPKIQRPERLLCISSGRASV